MVSVIRPTGDRRRNDPLLMILPGGISAGTLLVAFALLAAGFDHFWIVFPLGFGVILPTAIGLRVYAHTTQDTDGHKNTQPQSIEKNAAALETLRQRYATVRYSRWRSVKSSDRSSVCTNVKRSY